MDLSREQLKELTQAIEKQFNEPIVMIDRHWDGATDKQYLICTFPSGKEEAIELDIEIEKNGDVLLTVIGTRGELKKRLLDDYTKFRNSPLYKKLQELNKGV